MATVTPAAPAAAWIAAGRPAADEVTAVWTGSQMIVWGGQFVGKLTTTFAHDGAAYQPPIR